MSNNLFDTFFNPQVKPIDTLDTTSSTLFKPSPKKGQNGLYQAVIRFLPSPVDPANKSILSKFTCFLTNPRTNEKREIDCPSSIGQQSILTNTFFTLKNSQNPVLQENSKQFSRRQRFAALIQVLTCQSNPALENKIMVWQFGYKVNEKILAEMNPPMGEPKNPFNIITGRPFAVRVKEVGGFTNYDSCGFFDLDINQSGMRIQVPNAQGQPQWCVVTPQTLATEQGQKAVIDYLTNNAPDMTPYEYHAWDEQTTAFVNECVQIYSNPNATVQAISQAQMAAMPQGVGAPVTQPAAATPAMPGMPTTPMGGFVNTAPATPTPGNGFGMPPTIGMPAPTMTMPESGGFADSANIPAGIEDVLNAGQPTPAQPSAAPSLGVSLEDVLAGQMV